MSPNYRYRPETVFPRREHQLSGFQDPGALPGPHLWEAGVPYRDGSCQVAGEMDGTSQREPVTWRPNLRIPRVSVQMTN